MSLPHFNKLAVIACAGLTLSANAMARDTIQAAGSSTVLPFASVVAEEFGNNFAQFRTPVVGSGGTGGGMRQFCAGVGTDTIDIANASRAIKSTSRRYARTTAKQVIEACPATTASFRPRRCRFLRAEPRHVFLAQAARVPQNGKIVSNPYTHWNQIDSSLPKQEIATILPRITARAKCMTSTWCGWLQDLLRSEGDGEEGSRVSAARCARMVVSSKSPATTPRRWLVCRRSVMRSACSA